jgi:hypothetical protein
MTRIQIQCRRCGFPFRFADEDIDYGPSCPQCHAYADKVEVEVEVPDTAAVVPGGRAAGAVPKAEYGWFVVGRIGTPIRGPFCGEGGGYRWIMRTRIRTDDYPRDSVSVSYLSGLRRGAPRARTGSRAALRRPAAGPCRRIGGDLGGLRHAAPSMKSASRSPWAFLNGRSVASVKFATG